MDLIVIIPGEVSPFPIRHVLGNLHFFLLVFQVEDLDISGFLCVDFLFSRNCEALRGFQLPDLISPHRQIIKPLGPVRGQVGYHAVILPGQFPILELVIRNIGLVAGRT